MEIDEISEFQHLEKMSSFLTLQGIDNLKAFQLQIFPFDGDVNELADYVLSTIYAESREGWELIIHEIFTSMTCCIDFNDKYIELIKIL